MSKVRAVICIASFFICFVFPQSRVRSQSSDASHSGVSKSARYFPVGVFDKQTVHGSPRGAWYGRELAAMNEPSLFESRDDKKLHAYRFLWLRSFHRPVSVRLSINSGGDGFVVTKMTDGKGGRGGKLIVDSKINLDRSHIEEVMEKLQALNFWSMQTEESSGTAERRDALGQSKATIPHVDGAQWILEGAQNGKYHVVDRWSPGDSAYARFCKHLLELGEVDEKDVY